MNLIFFAPRFFPAIAGGEFYILNLAEYMKKRFNYNSIVICSNAIDYRAIKFNNGLCINENHRYYSKYNEIQIYRIKLNYNCYVEPENFNKSVEFLLECCKKLNLNIEIKVIVEYLKNGPNLNSFIKYIFDGLFNFKPDLIHSVYLPYSSILYSLIIAKFYKIPSICTPFYHIFNPRYASNSLFEVLKYYDTIISCTNYEKQQLIIKGIPESKIFVLPMGVNFEKYSNSIQNKSKQNLSFKKFYKINGDFILFCGHKNYEKGAITILKSIPLIYNYFPDLYYVFIGPSTAAFEFNLKKVKKLSNNILNIKPEQLNGYYDWRKISAFQECIIFVMPSRSDAYGMVYLEAWASKKPVIGAKTPVMEEVILNNYDGILVEFDNPIELSNSIIKLLKDKQLREYLGQNGYKKVLNNNRWEIIIDKTKEIYDSFSM